MLADKRHRAFTLVELLVVIGIVGLLISILLPTIGKAKKAANSANCMTNLRGWMQAITMYSTENKNRYWIDWGNAAPSASGQGTWMRVLSTYYRNLDRFRLCPSATEPTGTYGSATFQAWGPIAPSPGFIFDPTDFGSYGINHWMNDLPKTGLFVNGWRARPDLQWRRAGGHKGKSVDAPVIGDCEWYGGNPFDSASGLTPGAVPAVENALYKRHYGSNMWFYDMSRFAMNRHARGINMAFEDGSVRATPKADLWKLHWYKGFRPAGVTLSF